MAMTSSSTYKKHVTIDQGKQVLYVSLKKALYRWLRSALLFYNKPVKDLEYQRFTINPCYPCVANCIINVNKNKTPWNVDDLKISHVDKKEATTTIEWLQSVYYNEMQVSLGKKNNYIGMDLDFTFPTEVRMTMTYLIKTAMEELPEEIQGRATTPTAEHLLEMRPDGKQVLLDKYRSTTIHRAVA